MKIYASRNTGGFTLGMLNDVALSSTKVTIFERDDVGDAELAFEGYLNLAIKNYPELADCVITHLQVASTNKLVIDI